MTTPRAEVTRQMTGHGDGCCSGFLGVHAPAAIVNDEKFTVKINFVGSFDSAGIFFGIG